MVLFGLSSVTVRSNHLSIRRIRRSILGNAQPSARLFSDRSVAVNYAMVEMTATGATPPAETATTSAPEGLTEEQTLEKEELSKWKAAELFKVGITPCAAH